MTTAIVIGATGLVGAQLVGQLLADVRFSKVVVLARRPTGRVDPKLSEHVVDFGAPETWRALVQGEVLFSALGTTRGQAGSVAAQRVVDYDYQLAVAKAAAANGVERLVLVSSAAADAGSLSAYLKMKGELERDVQALGFQAVDVVRPGPLEGTREKPRAMEHVATAVLHAVTALGVWRAYRPIQGAQVARAMVRLATERKASRVVGPLECFTLAA
jgi:uncharacterized protein YbjT (DUF2867 family)